MAKPFNLTLARAPESEDACDSTDEHLVPEPALPARVLEIAGQKSAHGISGAMGTILERHGSAPSTPGQKVWVGADGSCVGTVGGGAIERELLAALGAMTRSSAARHEIRTLKLGPELGMCCGGQVVAMLEPIEGFACCLIVGGGHIATATAPLLARVGFAVTVVDSRNAWGQRGRIPGVRCVVDDYDSEGAALGAPSSSSVCLVMTHDHRLDQQAIEWALRADFAFVGGVGSRAKAQRTRDRLLARGFSDADAARVRMPIGVDIGARLPDEIATSIAAEMVGWRRCRKATDAK